jgi:hypothetical protein
MLPPETVALADPDTLTVDARSSTGALGRTGSQWRSVADTMERSWAQAGSGALLAHSGGRVPELGQAPLAAGGPPSLES